MNSLGLTNCSSFQRIMHTTLNIMTDSCFRCPCRAAAAPPSPQVVRRERTMSSFSRSFTLPDNVKDEGVAASLVNGVLKVTVPKAEPKAQPQPKRITVSGGEAA